MKDTLILILLLLLTTSLYAQVDHAFRTIRIRGLMQNVDMIELIEKATVNNYRVNLVNIQLVDYIPNRDLSVIGLCKLVPDGNKYKGYIYLRSDLAYNQTVLETVLAHELGHLMGLKHANNIYDIMTPIATTQKHQPNYNTIYNSELTHERWRRFFNQLKNEYQ